MFQIDSITDTPRRDAQPHENHKVLLLRKSGADTGLAVLLAAVLGSIGFPDLAAKDGVLTIPV